MAHIWVRAEQRDFEQRVGLTPDGGAKLLAAGHKVTIENSNVRAIPLEDYRIAGCSIEAENAWIDAPNEAIIFGLKELDEDGPDLSHRHIMFGHAYKGQADGPQLLNRFKRGGGTLYDLEYLTESNGRRIAAFGYWAGFAGAAVGVMALVAQQKNTSLGAIGVYPSKEVLLDELATNLRSITTKETRMPSAIIIGAKGRVGKGATDLFNAIGIQTTLWDIDETKHGGPFPEILEHTLFLNCILAGPQVSIFIPKSAIEDIRKLHVIADVSCDPTSVYNPIPIYDHSTTFASPLVRVASEPNPLDVMAIDNLPSMLPGESSQDYASQLLPYLMQIDEIGAGVWGRAEQTFEHHINQLFSQNTLDSR